MFFPTRHQLLRDRRSWLGTQTGLVADRDGALWLERVPGPADGKLVEVQTIYPYTREVSGIVPGPCDALFIADTEHDRVLFIDGLCDSQAWLTGSVGPFDSPRGLAISSGGGTGALLVADTGNGRVQCLSFPELEPSFAWHSFQSPTSTAVDTRARLLVVDAASSSVHRLRANGSADTAFDTAIAAQGKLQQPGWVACGSDDGVIVSDLTANEVLVFDQDGAFLASLPGPAGWLPGALCTHGNRVYVADAHSGLILVFTGSATDAASYVLLTSLSTWRGPVTALATDAGGALFLKPGLDAKFYRFDAALHYVPEGTLTAGPFDAGEDREWVRAWVDAQMPVSTGVVVDVVVKQSNTPPVAADWLSMSAMDVLLAQMTHDVRRYVWFRVRLATSSLTVSPALRQARTATAAEDLLDYLPMTYARNDLATEGFLSRWLQLVRGEFGRVEELLDDMPRHTEAQLVAGSDLTWLARWLALELPQIASEDERRALIGRAASLFERRGTARSIAEFVELHTGIRPVIVEAFADRRIWVLGESSRLDFDTRLPDLDPLGMVVPDDAVAATCCPSAGDAKTSCSPCATAAENPTAAPRTTPIGRAIVGESGPLASYQIGMPLFAQTAHRFCVIVDRYRTSQSAVLPEIARIVDREKPAHADYRIDLIEPETRIGLQSRIGIDAIVGGDPPPLRLDGSHLGIDTHTPPVNVARIGTATLDGVLALT